MLRNGLCLICFILIPCIGFTQLSDGATAIDFTVTDINGQTHNLFSDLNQGKTVIVQFSATWCSPCWNYHQTGILESFYNQYGPNGTDEVNVYYLEADFSTPTSCLFGNCGSTIGDWVTGTNFPIINLTPSNGGNVPNNYQISYYPTIYAICPNRKVYEVGTSSQSALESYISSCNMKVDQVNLVEEQCFNDGTGSISLTVEDGFGNKNFVWSNGANSADNTGIQSGVYDVLISDANGFFIEESYTLGGPEEPLSTELISIQSSASCNGINDAFIEVAASGGTAPYSFSWSHGPSGSLASNLSAGVYTVTVEDANLCTYQETFEVVEPDPLGVSVNTINAVCGSTRGAVIMQADGGTMPYTYRLSDGTNLPNGQNDFVRPGTYDAICEDANGCIAAQTINIVYIDPPVADAGEADTISCSDQTVTIGGSQTSSGSNYEFEWINEQGQIVGNTAQLEVQSEGLYTLEVRQLNTFCVASDEVEVFSNRDIPKFDISSEGRLDCANDSMFLAYSGVTDPMITYEWLTNDTVLSTDSIIRVGQSGTYSLVVTNTSSDCSSMEEVVITVDDTLPTFSISNEGLITCTNEELELSIEGEGLEVLWFDQVGDTLASDSSIIVGQAGLYSAQVINSKNGCFLDTTLMVGIDTMTIEFTAPEYFYTGCNRPIEIYVIANDTITDNYQFLWSTVNGNIISGWEEDLAIVDSSGVYSVEITNLDNGCVQSAEVFVEAVDSPNAEIIYTLSGDTLHVEVLNQYITEVIKYDFGDNTLVNSRLMNYQHVYTEAGTYNVCIEVNNICGSKTYCKEIEIEKPSSIVDQSLNAFRLYPNPNHGQFVLNLTKTIHGQANVVIYDMNGQKVFQQGYSSGLNPNEKFNLPRLSAGLYIMKLQTKDGQFQQRFSIVE